MVALSTLVFTIIVIAAFAKYAPRFVKWTIARRRLIYHMERLPGSRALPLIGSLYKFSSDRLGESNLLEFQIKFAAFKKQTQADIDKYSRNGVIRYWAGTIPIVTVGSAVVAEVYF